MPDTLPSSTDRTVVVRRHGALTYISLGFNALILLLVLIGIVSHHDRPQPPRDRGGDGRMEAADRGERFDHHGFGDMREQGKQHDFADRDDGGFGGMRHSWKHREFGDRGEQCPGDSCSGGSGEEGPHHFGMGRNQGWGAPGGMGDHQPMSAEAMTDRFMLALTGKLTLTDPESAQIRPIVQQGITQFQKDMEAQKDAHQKMLEDAKTKIRAVLTPDQQKEFDAMAAGFGAPPAPGK
jgi:hypothetical protein